MSFPADEPGHLLSQHSPVALVRHGNEMHALLEK